MYPLPTAWELYLLWLEVNFQPCELPEVSFSTDKDLRTEQGFYTDQGSYKTGLNLSFNWIWSFNPVFNWFGTGSY